MRNIAFARHPSILLAPRFSARLGRRLFHQCG
jgi:hypothetical protein